MTKWPWRYRSRSKALHATHHLMLVIICVKYGKNPSRTVNATERTRFSRSRPNDIEIIGQGQMSLHATHPLMLMMICAKYGMNASRIVDFYSRWKPKFFFKMRKFGTEPVKNCRCYRADTIFKAKAKWPWRYRSRSKGHYIQHTLSY